MQYPLEIKVTSRATETFQNIDELKAKIALVSNVGLKNLWSAIGDDDVDEAIVLWQGDERASRNILVAKNKMKGFLRTAANLDAEDLAKDIWYMIVEPGTTTEYGWKATWAELKGLPAPEPPAPEVPTAEEPPKKARKGKDKAEPAPVVEAEPTAPATDDSPVDENITKAMGDAIRAHDVVVDVTVRAKTILLSGTPEAVFAAAKLLGEKIEPAETATLERRKDMRLPEAPAKVAKAKKAPKAKKEEKAASVTVATPESAPKAAPKPSTDAPRTTRAPTVAKTRKLAYDNGPRESLGLFPFRRGRGGNAEVMAQDYYGDGSYERTCPKCENHLHYADFGARLMRLKRDGSWVRVVQPQCKSCRRGAAKKSQ